MYKGSRIYKSKKAWDGLRYTVSDLVSRNVLIVNNIYTFSTYIKTDEGLDLSNKLYFFNGSGSFKQISDINVEQISTEWSQIFCNIQYIGIAEGNKNYIGFETNSGTNGLYYYMSCPQLERGYFVSDYCPAPEDDYSMIQQMQSQIAVLTQQIATLQTK